MKKYVEKLTSTAAHRWIPWKRLRDQDIRKCHLNDSSFLGRSVPFLKLKLNKIRFDYQWAYNRKLYDDNAFKRISLRDNIALDNFEIQFKYAH